MPALSHTVQGGGNPTPYLILGEQDYRIFDEADFGAPGLKAIEVLGPLVEIQASGPLVTIHDSTVDPHLGIDHHRHRNNVCSRIAL